MILGIDASNIRVGGGVTHLREVLRAADPARHGFERIVVWARQRTLDQFPVAPWLVGRHEPVFERGFLARAHWQRQALSAAATRAGCSVLWVPGGSYGGDFRPIVAMSQNMLPFEGRELRRFGLSPMTVKMLLLRWTQSRTFRRSDGVIFLSHFASETIQRHLGGPVRCSTIIPHGVTEAFRLPPVPQRPRSAYDAAQPFRLLYVSQLDRYKHQLELIEAVTLARHAGYPVVLELVGAGTPAATRALWAQAARFGAQPEHTAGMPDGRRQGPEPARAAPAFEPPIESLALSATPERPGASWLVYQGPRSHAELRACYERADAVVFASTCENLPNILMEGMSSGRPILCSRKRPMTDLLGDAGDYFDAEEPTSIAAAIMRCLDDPVRRTASATAAAARVAPFTWSRCADETLAFLAQVAAQAAGTPRPKPSGPAGSPLSS